MPIPVLLGSAGLFYCQLSLIGLDSDLRFSRRAVTSSVLSLYLFLAITLPSAVSRAAPTTS